jgi:hypothetical protein
MQITSQKNGSALVLSLYGALDITTADALEQALELANIEHLTVDLDACHYISSSGLRVLMRAHKQLAAGNYPMVLTNVSREVYSIFDVSGLAKIIPIHRKSPAQTATSPASPINTPVAERVQIPAKSRQHLPGSDGEHRAQEAFGTTARASAFYNNQVLDYLNPMMCDFISGQEMFFVATADGKGHADCSLRLGLPGFVLVLDPHTLIYPEYRGNGVMASVGNILENQHIGMLFIDFFQSTIGLHVNGKAKIIEKTELLERFTHDDEFKKRGLSFFEHMQLSPEMMDRLIELSLTPGGRNPERWVAVEVEEAYIHCSKHIPLLKKMDKVIHWGTDDQQLKGGDAFKAKSCPRPWVQPVNAEPTPN